MGWKNSEKWISRSRYAGCCNCGGTGGGCCPFLTDVFRVGGVGGKEGVGTGAGRGCGGAALEGRGGGGGGMLGAVTLLGGGGAVRELVAPSFGGDGGFATGGFSARDTGFGGGGVASFSRSCDWCKEYDDADSEAGEGRASRILCALDTVTLFVGNNFFGGGDGLRGIVNDVCGGSTSGGLGATFCFPNPRASSALMDSTLFDT